MIETRESEDKARLKALRGATQVGIADVAAGSIFSIRRGLMAVTALPLGSTPSP